ncbi:MAG: YeeE/YedE family protein [Myxococcota bacterium]|nr:YeeE/YedE family protein [Myxococcota bacterium]
MDGMWALRGLAGGALIGASASLLLWATGRVAGVSGILEGLLARRDDGERTWRALFVLGLVLGGALALLSRDTFVAVPPTLGIAVIAGLLVGVGTRIGSGCTSGHGVCGISRLSVRSIVATLTFIGTGAITVAAVRALGASS